MKKIFLAAAVAAAFYTADAQQLRTPAASPTTTVKQDFALSSIEINYSRPGKKGRNIFGDLVPFGKVWRTGANNATVITFGEDVMVGNTKVPAGKYGLLTIPEATEWTVIISKQTDVTSPASYKQEMDVARVKVPVSTLPFSVETFTIGIDNMTSNSCDIGLLWDNVYVAVPVKADIDSKIMAQIKNIMEGDTKPYFAAAMYYMDNGKDLNKALEWLNKAEEQNPNAFWVVHQKAKCLAKLGKKNEARDAAIKSKDMAKKQQNDDYVKLNDELLKTLN